ncbi:hypothetical protein ANAEL_02834 [Anaerolineales bacterium]|nr:hypothetical protein ANAEL_02834 [Anaerolineales bacterium]
MRLIFRYDDFGATGVEAFLPIDRAVFATFTSLGVPLVVGVTPFMADVVDDPECQMFHELADDQERRALLAEGLTRGWQLALHGFRHLAAMHGKRTEFAGQPFDVQQAMINGAKEAVQTLFPGYPLQVFIPPWNSFDRQTLECLKNAGFKILCAGPHTEAGEVEGVTVVPSLLTIRQFVSIIRSYSLETLVSLMGKGTLIVTFHAYELTGGKERYSIPLAEFQDVLRLVVEAGVPVDVFNNNQQTVNFQPARQFLLRLHRLSVGDGWLEGVLNLFLKRCSQQ